MGYHLNKIEKGSYGTISKIQEEFDELRDADHQGVKILILCELSDLYGAIEGYVEQQLGMTMSDLKSMSDLTKSSFKDGSRS
jgi:hypothetical protein